MTLVYFSWSSIQRSKLTVVCSHWCFTVLKSEISWLAAWTNLVHEVVYIPSSYSFGKSCVVSNRVVFADFIIFTNYGGLRSVLIAPISHLTHIHFWVTGRKSLSVLTSNINWKNFKEMNQNNTVVDGDEDLIEITKSELAQKEKPKINGSLNFNLTNRP